VRNNHFPHLLLGRKLRHDRQQRINESVEDQASFDELFTLIFHHEKLVAQHAMRAVTVVVKNTPTFLQPHREQLLSILQSPDFREIRAYVVQLISKLALKSVELERVWRMLSYMARNTNEQKTIRGYALQSLYELTNQHAPYTYEFQNTLNMLAYEQIPFIQAKVLKLRGLMNAVNVPV
jgi:hypothetical protein